MRHEAYERNGIQTKKDCNEQSATHISFQRGYGFSATQPTERPLIVNTAGLGPQASIVAPTDLASRRPARPDDYDVISVTVQWLVGRIYKGDNGGRWSITSMFIQDMPPAATQEDAKREFGAGSPELINHENTHPLTAWFD